LFQQALQELLLNKFKVPSLFVASSQVLSLIPLNPLCTGLIVDSGYSETRVLPIYEGVPLNHALEIGPLGSYHAQQRLQDLLRDYGRLKNRITGDSAPVSKPISSTALEDILARLCFVQPQQTPQQQPSLPISWPQNPKPLAETTGPAIATSTTAPVQPAVPIPAPAVTETQQPQQSEVQKNQQQPKARSFKLTGQEERLKFPTYASPSAEQLKSAIVYPIDKESSLDVNLFVRSEAANLLFDGDEESFSIPSLVLESLKKCSEDVRFELARNLLLVGGLTMLPGFQFRLLYELERLVQTPMYSELKGLQSHFGFIFHQFAANTLCWVGGSVLGSLDYCNQHSVTKENSAASNVPKQTN